MQADRWLQVWSQFQKSVAFFTTVFCSRLQGSGIERVVAFTVNIVRTIVAGTVFPVKTVVTGTVFLVQTVVAGTVFLVQTVVASTVVLQRFDLRTSDGRDTCIETLTQVSDPQLQ